MRIIIRIHLMLLMVTCSTNFIALHAQTLEWYGIIRGNSNSTVYSTCRQIDQVGNLLIAGSYSKTVDFDFGPGVVEKSSRSGDSDYFIAKYSPAGTLIWVHVDEMPHALTDNITNLSIGVDGNIYASGTEKSPESSFILKLDSSGNEIWKRNINFVKYYGSEFNYTRIQSICVDTLGEVMVQGYFTDSTDFDPGPNEFVLYPNGETNTFFLKLNMYGLFEWVKPLGGVSGGSGSKVGAQCTVQDSDGNIIILGSYNDSTDFDLSSSTHILYSAQGSNYYLAKYSFDLDLIWIKTFSGPGGGVSIPAFRGDLALGPHDSIYMILPWQSSFIYDPGGQDFEMPISLSSSHWFIKFDANGIALRSFCFGKGEHFGEIHVLPNGEMVINSATNSGGDLDPRIEGIFAYDNNSDQNEITYFARYDVMGNFLWARMITRINFNYNPLVVDSAGNIYVVSFSSYDIDELVGDGNIPDIEIDPAASISFILKYRPVDCDTLKEEYVIKDDISDTGIEPNPGNLPSWQNPNIRDTQAPHLETEHQISYNSFTKDFIRVRVTKLGCNSTTSAKVELYYSIAPSGMEWPENWDNYVIDAGSELVIAGNKFGEVKIPVLYMNDVWETAVEFQFPFNPDLIDVNDINIGILARIVSAQDPDTFPENMDLLPYVVNNNNVAWRIFKLRN